MSDWMSKLKAKKAQSAKPKPPAKPAPKEKAPPMEMSVDGLRAKVARRLKEMG